MKLGKLAAVLLATSCMGSSLLANKAAPIVQPGPIGGAPKALTSEDAIKLANTSHSPADVLFMQGMIVHHQQAVDMAALVKERTNQQDIVAVAGRIDASQCDGRCEGQPKWLVGAIKTRPASAPLRYIWRDDMNCDIIYHRTYYFS